LTFLNILKKKILNKENSTLILATLVKEDAHLHLNIPQHLDIPQHTPTENLQSGKITLILATQVSEEAQV